VTVRRYLSLAVVLLLAFGWSPAIHSTLAGPPSEELIAEIWAEPLQNAICSSAASR
jgi:hypothetical protein